MTVIKNIRMHELSKRIIILAAVAGFLLVALTLGVAYIAGRSGERAARATVEAFGAQLQNVALLDPSAAAAIESAYAPYIFSELIDRWKNNPASAPGRLTSSPWPERIDVENVHRQGAGYVVSGSLIEKTSAGDERATPVIMLVLRESGGWKIASFDQQQTE